MFNKSRMLKSAVGGTILVAGAAVAKQLPHKGKRALGTARRLVSPQSVAGTVALGSPLLTAGDGRAAGEEDYERYVDGTPLVELFGDTPRVRFIAAVLSEPDEPLTVADIEQLSGVDADQIEATARDLDRKGLVTCHQGQDNTLECRVETDNPAVSALRSAEEGQIAYRRRIGR